MSGRLFNLLTLALFALGFSGSARAEISRSLMRSPEALAMGGAYTAFVEDRDAAFYNPAGVAAYDRLSLHMITADVAGSDWVISGWKTLQDLKNPSGASLNKLMGENISVQAGASTAVLAPGFALIGFYDAQGALYAKNQAFPKIEYGYQKTSGVQAAFAYGVKDGRMRGKGKKNAAALNEWRFGVGGKFLTRTGGYRLLNASELFSISSMTMDSLIGGSGSGYGFDLGVQRVQHINPNTTAYWGAAFLNVGDITFSGGAAPQRGDLSTGFAIKYKEGIASVTLAYDIQQINQSGSFSKKQNLGGKLGLPLLDLYAGFHQGFFTYGAAFDIWVLRVAATVYREALGSYPQQNPEDRIALRIDFKMDL